MIHARRKIITAAKLVLDGLVAPGFVTAVSAGRQAPLPVEQMPYLLVYGRNERSAPLTMGGARRKMERELTLAIDIVTSSTDDNDEEADAIALEVERAMTNDPALGGNCRNLWLSQTTMDARAEAETRTGRARLEFTVSYQTVANAPDQAV